MTILLDIFTAKYSIDCSFTWSAENLTEKGNIKNLNALQAPSRCTWCPEERNQKRRSIIVCNLHVIIDDLVSFL